MHRWGSWMSGQTLMCPGILSFSNGFDIQIIHDIQRYENRYWHNLLFREAEMPIPFIVPVKIICGFCLHERGEKIRFNIWKSLQSCTFGRCKPSYDIVSLKDAILKSRICTIHKASTLFFCKCNAFCFHLWVESIAWIVINNRRVLVIGCYKCICKFLFCGCEERCL